MANLPGWTLVEKTKAEVKRRFGKADQDDFMSRMEKLSVFDRAWKKERVGLTKRMDGLCSLFDAKMRDALHMWQVIHNISADVVQFETDENKERPEMPAVFSVGPFTSATAATLFVECREFFVQLLETIKAWSRKAAIRIRAHNAEF